jgi:hypothetical protein
MSKTMGNEYRVDLNEKPVRIEITKTAMRALQERDSPLYLEMELYFSCLIRKQLRIHEQWSGNPATQVTDKLYIAFRPVMTAACGKDFDGDAPPLTEFPIAKTSPYVPKWVTLDYHHGQWAGEFGYANR